MDKGLRSIMIAVCIVVCAGLAQAITCDECKEIDRKLSSLETQLARKETALKEASDKKRYSEVTEIHRQVVNLRREVVDLKKQNLGCKDACRPDVVKATECTRLRSQIMKMEEDAASPVDKIDELYRDLASCNKELTGLKSR